MSKNRTHDSVFKAKVVIEAVKEEKTISQIGSEYGVHPNQIGQWKKQVLEELPLFFSDLCRDLSAKRKKSDL